MVEGLQTRPSFQEPIRGRAPGFGRARRSPRAPLRGQSPPWDSDSRSLAQMPSGILCRKQASLVGWLVEFKAFPPQKKKWRKGAESTGQLGYGSSKSTVFFPMSFQDSWESWLPKGVCPPLARPPRKPWKKLLYGDRFPVSRTYKHVLKRNWKQETSRRFAQLVQNPKSRGDIGLSKKGS